MDPIRPSPTSEDASLPENELGHRRHVKDLSEQIADLFKDIGERMLELRAIGVPTAEWLDLTVRHFSQRLQDSLGDSTRGVIPIFLDLVTNWIEHGALPADALNKAVEIGTGLGNDGGGPLGAMSASTGFDLLKAALPAVLELFGKSSNSPPPAPEPYVPRQLTPEELDALTQEDNRRLAGAHNPDGIRMMAVIDRLFAQAPKMTDASGKPVEGQAPALECFVTLKAGVQANGALSVTPEGGLRLLAPNQIPPAERGQQPKMVMVEHFFDYDQVADIAVIREVKASEPSRIVTAS